MAGKTRSLLADLSGATKQDILELAEAHHVRFLRLMFTDILGVNKNVEIPASQFAKALAGDIMFDAIKTEAHRRLLPQQAEQVRIVLSTLGDDAVAMGAALAHS